MDAHTPVHILLIGDRDDDPFSLDAVLRFPEYNLEIARTGEDAFACLGRQDFAVILLDLRTPNQEWAEIARRIRGRERFAATPIVLMTGTVPDEWQISLGYELGTADFLTSPLDPRLVKCKVAIFAELYRKGEKIRQQRNQLREATESRSRDQLKVIFEHLSDGIILHDQSFRCIYANEAGARLVGFPSPQALEGRSAFEIVTKDFDIFDQDGQVVFRDRFPTWQVIRGGQKSAEMVQRLKDRASGREYWLVVSSRPILDEFGFPSMAVTIYRDISLQRRTEDNERFLASSTAILASSLDFNATLPPIAALAVARMADWCRILLPNEAGQLEPRVVRHTDAHLADLADQVEREYPLPLRRGQGSPEVFRTGKSVLWAKVTEEELRHVAVDEGHFELLRKMGLRSVLIVPLRARDKILGTMALSFAGRGRYYDIVDLSVAEELGRRIGMAIENSLLFADAQAQGERLSHAVQSRDDFISIASHELKTPLTSLILHAEMAALQLERSEAAEVVCERFRKFVAVSTVQIDRLSRLVEEMLDVSRIGNGKLSMQVHEHEFGTLVRQVVEDFAEPLREAGCPATWIGEEVLRVRCDPYRIEQVVTNLLTNAMRYGRGRPVEVWLRRDGSHACLGVRDQGIGIAREDHERIFERFERAVSASDVSGLGLGLYIVRQIVRAHGGEVSVESEPGQGSEFTIRLPLL